MNATRILLFPFALTALLVGCLPSQETDDGQELSISDTFASRFLKADIPFEVFLPEDFHDQKDSVDLLVVLDGNQYAGIASNTAYLYEFGEKIRPTVVLSLPSTAKSRWEQYTPTKATADNDGGEDPLYQYTGNFGNFSKFMETELIPYLEKTYGVQFCEKTIFGHSMGGLGVLSFLVLSPAIFDNYISASPSTMYDDHFIFKKIEESGSLRFQAVFLTAALNDANGYRENVNWLSRYLTDHQVANQRIGVKIYETETHGTSGVKSLIDGLEFIGKN